LTNEHSFHLIASVKKDRLSTIRSNAHDKSVDEPAGRLPSFSDLHKSHSTGKGNAGRCARLRQLVEIRE